MQIIDRVDINYFRSVSSLSLTNCNHVNVITGGNDSGKSNILRALNLFFNNQVEPHLDFNFLRDLNRDREEEARSAKGRMTIWIKVHFNNFLKWKSLPDKFYVKRTWNRYDANPVDTYPEDVPATTMGRFLNKIRYHYVPAVRGRDIFADLLADLHDTLIQDESRGLRQSSDVLVGDLHKLTESMSAEILDRVKIHSTITIPESLQDLFRALDFSTRFGEHVIPLVMRGDGIQSRHLPFILNYIAAKSNQHHIWGYEEPENSLEISKSFEMADDFRSELSKENQIFLTTHSPAFYDISGKRAARWYVENREEDGKNSTHVEQITSTSIVDKTMGLLSLITPRMKDLYDEYEDLKDTISEMQITVAAAQCPIVYVEGPTDVKILETARDKLGLQGLSLRFQSANGAGDISLFLNVSIRVKRDDRPLVGIYDSDARGRKEFDRFKSYRRFQDTSLRILDRGKRIFAGVLNVPGHLIKAEEAFKSIGMSLPLPIEFMFRRELIMDAISDGVLVLSPRIARIANEELPLEINVDSAISGRIAQDFLYLAKSVDDDCKVPFSEWLANRPPADFEVFRQLFEDLTLAIE